MCTEEWALAEAFNAPEAVTVKDLATPLYADTDELKNARTELALGGAQPLLRIVVQPDRPALFTAARTTLAGESGAVEPPLPAGLLRCRGQNLTLNLAGPAAWTGARFHDAVWVKADGGVWWLKDMDAGGGFELASYADVLARLRHSPGAGYAGALGNAPATALAWAVREVKRSRRGAVIFWELLPGEHAGVIELAAPAPNAGSLFRLSAVEITE